MCGARRGRDQKDHEGVTIIVQLEGNRHWGPGGSNGNMEGKKEEKLTRHGDLPKYGGKRREKLCNKNKTTATTPFLFAPKVHYSVF